MSEHDAPVDWRSVVSMIATVPELHTFWNDNAGGLGPDDQALLRHALDSRKREIEGTPAAGANPPAAGRVLSGTEQKLLELDEERERVVDAYRKALEEEANATADYRRTRAKTWLRIRDELDKAGGKVTNGEADMRADADDAVCAARQRAYLSEGVAKATRANLDRIEQSFQLHRSLLVRDRPNA